MSPLPAPPPLLPTRTGGRPGAAWLPMLGLLLILLPAARHASAGEGSAEECWAATRQAAIDRLHELATWCNSKRLYAGRATAYELVLGFDPDDETARKRLRYRRGKDGRWTRTPRHKPPRNLGTGKKKYEERLASWRTWLQTEIHPLVGAGREDTGARLRCEILRATIPALPDDPELRRANGEVRHTWHDTTRWVLVESQVAKARRPELRRVGAAAVDDVRDPYIEEPRDDERVETVEWGEVLVGPHVRVLGTASPPEMDQQYTHCEALWPVLRAVFALDAQALVPTRESERITVYVTKSTEVGNRFLRALPGIESDALERLAALGTGRIAERRAVFVKDGSRPWRLEAGAKQLAALGIADALGVDDADAWLAEGLAHYVTWLVTDTRQVFRTGDGSETGAAEWVTSPHASVNLSAVDDWLGAGHDLLTSEAKPDLSTIAAKGLETLTPDEILTAYCLVAYLLEGRPEDGAAFLRTVGRTPATEFETAVLAHLGVDLSALEARLVRWLAETTGRIDRE